MKKTLLLFFLPLAMTISGAGALLAQSEPAAPPAQADQTKPAAPHKTRKNRKKSAKQAPEAAPAAAAPQAAPKSGGKRPILKEPVGSVSGARPAIKTLDARKANSLLFSTMERLETLIAYHDNLRLQAPVETVNKIAALLSESNKASAEFFRVAPPDPVRETVKPYPVLLSNALKSVKMLKDVKDRIIPEDSEKALGLCRDVNAAIDEDLSAARLKIPSAAAGDIPAGKDAEDEEKPAAAGPAAAEGEPLSGETGALATLAELRKAVKAYKAAEGKYPKKLVKLAPKYIPDIPAVSVADHTTTDQVLEIDSVDYDENLHQAITDSGRWLYFTDKKSKYYGQVFIDCSHKTSNGVELYRAGVTE